MTPDHNQLTERLNRFTHREYTGGTPAAVALLVTEEGYGSGLAGMPDYANWNSDGALLLTQRASHLKRHAGQWALPGGRVDADETLMEAAIRETREEINLNLGNDDYIGRLDDYVTRSGFVMSGLVFWAGAAHSAKPSPDEVESIHRIPFTELDRDDAPILNHNELNHNEPNRVAGEETSFNPVLRMPVSDDWIAAPTAAFLYQFREVCLRDKHTRVAHFEQPEFAWK